MSCGMVRKVDELGRVVIPKEMRRVLNIKTGSSIEMTINDQNEVVLKKFSEMSNILPYAELVADVLFDAFSLPCLVCDDEKVLCAKGVSKKEFLGKPRPSKSEKWLTYPVSFDGFGGGCLMIMNDNAVDKSVEKSLYIFSKFLGNLLSD